MAILDLTSVGHQPMRSVSGRFVIAFNGEIYNHRALRQELQAAGRLRQPWRGQSDTETLLAAIEAWGLETSLERCVGMFALVLWDRRERVLQLARDKRRKLAAAIRAAGSLQQLHTTLTSVWADPAALLQLHWLEAAGSGGSHPLP